MTFLAGLALGLFVGNVLGTLVTLWVVYRIGKRYQDRQHEDATHQMLDELIREREAEHPYTRVWH